MNTAAVVAIATFLVVFIAVGGVAWIVVSRHGRGDAQLPLTVRRRPSTVAVALTVAAAGIVSFVLVIAAARFSLPLFEPPLAWVTAQFWAIFFKPYGAFVLGFLVLPALGAAMAAGTAITAASALRNRGTDGCAS